MIDPKLLTDPHTYLLVMCDCISTGDQGSAKVKEFFQQFPYANVYQNRYKTSLPKPGNFELVGQGTAEQPYIIVAYGQIYPSNASYPNDNPQRRRQWLTQICRQLTSIARLERLIIPDYLPPYQRQCWANFVKKYYLTTKQTVQVYDYQGQVLFSKARVSTDAGADDSRPVAQVPPLDQYTITDIVSWSQLRWRS